MEDGEILIPSSPRPGASSRCAPLLNRLLKSCRRFSVSMSRTPLPSDWSAPAYTELVRGRRGAGLPAHARPGAGVRRHGRRRPRRLVAPGRHLRQAAARNRRLGGSADRGGHGGDARGRRPGVRRGADRRACIVARRAPVTVAGGAEPPWSRTCPPHSAGPRVAALGLPLRLRHNDLHEHHTFDIDGELRFCDFGDALLSEHLAELFIPPNVLKYDFECGADDPSPERSSRGSSRCAVTPRRQPSSAPPCRPPFRWPGWASSRPERGASRRSPTRSRRSTATGPPVARQPAR